MRAPLVPLAILLLVAGLLTAACGGGQGDADRYPPLHPTATPLSPNEFEEALRQITFDLDTAILKARSPLDSATTLAHLQTRLAEILPGIPVLFEAALERVAELAPPADWADDHSRFVAEQRELLRLRIGLFGALAANQEGRAAELAAEIESRQAALQAQLDPEFLALTAAFFDPRRYGGTPR